MKRFLKPVSFLLMLLVTILLSACTETEFPEGEHSNFDINANMVSFQENVVLLNDLGIDSVYIVSDEEIRLITSINLDLNQLRGKVVVYSSSRTSANFFIGRVLTARRENGYITLTTEIPSMDEVFSELDISAVLNMNNVRVAFTADDEDNVRYCGVVGNEVWDSISPVVIDSSYNKKQGKAKSSTPIDLTLKFEAQAGQRFAGSIYYRIKGSLVIKKNNSYELSANQIIGLDGTFNMAEQSVGRTYIPLLSLKNGITLYTNKVIGIRVKPSLNFFYSGSISLQAGFNYEVMNVDSYITYENENFSNRSWDNKRDWYFRVKNLNAQASFGLSLNSDFYAFIFCDNFFRAGVKAAAGIEIAGEGNVGIQFPDIASFDCAVRVNPFLEVTPFVVVRKPNLQRIDGPTFNVATSGFTADLLPNIHDINYQRENTRLHYDGMIRSMNNSFVETKESGIALFEKGHDRPIDHGAAAGCMAKRGKAGSNFGSSFQIEEGKEYEIAPYVKSLNNEYVYGEKIEIGDSASTTLRENAFQNLWNTSIIFHYNYTGTVSGAVRIDDNSQNPNAIPIYRKVTGTVCNVYTSASEIYAPVNSSQLFFGCRSVDFGTGFNTSKVTNMSQMFAGGSYTSLDLSTFNTSKVTDMSEMFCECYSLTNINLSSFNTERVTDMSGMFAGCPRLTSLDLSLFNTARVTNMLNMFYDCSGLTTLDLSSFNTDNVTNMGGMFHDCNRLTSLNVSSFNTARVTIMGWMFHNCSSLTNLDLSSFNTSNVTAMDEMFSGCSILTILDLSSFRGTNLSYMGAMFLSSGVQQIVFHPYFNIPSSCNINAILCGVGSYGTPTTIRCNNQVKEMLMSDHNTDTYRITFITY